MGWLSFFIGGKFMIKDFAYETSDDKFDSMGRNGSAKTTGVEISHRHTTVTLTPLTSRYQPQNCYISMPSEAMTKLALFWLSQLPLSEIVSEIHRAKMPPNFMDSLALLWLQQLSSEERNTAAAYLFTGENK
jgi:hypothetical protein